MPPHASTAGADEAIAFCEMAGLYLDPWQQSALVISLGESACWKCPHCVYRPVSTTENAVLACPDHPTATLLHPGSAFEVALVVPRQNGKGVVLQARELVELFLIPGPKTVVHSAHEFKTSKDHFKRLSDVIDKTPDLTRRLKGKPSHRHGDEGFTLEDGSEMHFTTRTKGAGRGWSADLLVYDEAQDLPEEALAASFPLLRARSNPQVWYTGSAVDQQVDRDGVVFARVRERGLAGSDPKLAYLEWSADLAMNEVNAEAVSDPALWAQANPALGIRIEAEHVVQERAAMSSRKFAVELLAVGDWPRTEEGPVKVIPTEIWRACCDPESEEAEDARFCFAFDVTPDQSVGTICLSAKRADGLDHIEFVEQDRGMAWIPRRMQELYEKYHRPLIVCDGTGPISSILPEFKDLKVKVLVVTAKEHQQACAMFFTATGAGEDPSTLRHLGQEELDAAVEGAAKRPMGDAWLWSRKNSTVDISPLVGCTLALWGSRTRNKAPQVINLNDYL